MKNLKIPKNAIKYILFQRTGYLQKNLLFNLLTCLGYFKYFHKLSINLKEFFFLTKIKSIFNKDIHKEYSEIKTYLPKKIDSILDIGCGVAGIDILISNHYHNNIGIHLIDKTQVDKNIYYRFKQKGSFYNSLELSRKLLEFNGIDHKKIHLQEATPNNQIKSKKRFDVIISLISWGYHYPVSTYLDDVYNKLKTNGILILDIRKNTSGEKEIKDKFGNYKIILETKKHIKVIAKK